MESSSKQTLTSTISLQEINLDSFKDELIKSRINLNELPFSSSISLEVNNRKNSLSESNSKSNINHELPLGLQVFVLPGDDYFNKSSNLDYIVNLTVDEEKNEKHDHNQQTIINLKIDYKFPKSLLS